MEGSKSYHICMNLQTAIDMALGKKSELKKIKIILNCEHISKEDLLTDLFKMKARGYTAIPSEGCDNHINGHCQGHPAPPQDKSSM